MRNTLDLTSRVNALFWVPFTRLSEVKCSEVRTNEQTYRETYRDLHGETDIAFSVLWYPVYMRAKHIVGLSGHSVSFFQVLVPRFPSKSGLIHKHIVKHIVYVLCGSLGGHCFIFSPLLPVQVRTNRSTK
jgi:hypothetical protein